MRLPRRLQVNALYHVVTRANRKEMILKSDVEKRLFLEVIARAKNKFSFTITNFCIMENHFHLLIRPGKGENLSRIMQWILSVFAMSYNRRRGTTGHVWGERFYSKIIGSFQAFIHTMEYIDKNPIKAHLCRYFYDWFYCGAYWHRSGWHDLVLRLPGYLYMLFPHYAQHALPDHPYFG